jgi:hypothetical protein
MGLFWRILASRFIVDFIIQSNWLQNVRRRWFSLAIHSFLLLAVGFFFLRMTLFEDPAIIQVLLISTLFDLAIGVIRMFKIRRREIDLSYFLIDQLVFALSIYTLCSGNIDILFPAVPGGAMPEIAMSIFAIWGTPIVINLWKGSYGKSKERHSFFENAEEFRILQMIERSSIFIAITMGGYFSLIGFLALVARIAIMSKLGKLKIPLASWVIVSSLAFLSLIP